MLCPSQAWLGCLPRPACCTAALLAGLCMKRRPGCSAVQPPLRSLHSAASALQPHYSLSMGCPISDPELLARTIPCSWCMQCCPLHRAHTSISHSHQDSAGSLSNSLMAVPGCSIILARICKGWRACKQRSQQAQKGPWRPSAGLLRQQSHCVECHRQGSVGAEAQTSSCCQHGGAGFSALACH